MAACRKYGQGPARVVLAHGGPGALGEMRPVAARLGRSFGVLEPLQTRGNVADLVEELRGRIAADAAPPVALVGFSWGAWLALLLAGEHPALVARLVLVGCGPLEARDAGEVTRTRLAALEEPERTELRGLLEGAGAPGFGGAALARLGALLRRTDFCDPCEPGETDGDDPSADPADAVEFRPDLHRSVWAEAAALRASGRLAAACARVACPILVLHGDRDPHPVRCVVEPLAARGCAVHPEILARCGHTPWLEREGREPFFAALERELAGCR